MTTPTPGERPKWVSRGVQRSIVVTSVYGVVSLAAIGFAGIVIARSLGPSVKGEYAAIIAWFGLLSVLCELGQSAATTFFVARDPDRAPDYVAISRNITLASGLAILAIGMVAAPLFGSGSDTTALGYRLMFATCLVGLVGVSYASALQGSSIARWNLVRVSQPMCYLVVVVVLHLAGRLTLITALVALLAATVIQTTLGYGLCVHSRLTGGRPSLALTRPLTRYGAGELAATIPVVMTARLDRLALSLLVDPAVLGNYAVAVSVTSLTVPLAAGLGYVAFPRIAAQRGLRSTARLQWWAVMVSAGIAIVFLLPLTAFAPRLVPAVFGAGFRDAAILMVFLAPGGVFLACQQVCADLLRGHGRPFEVARAQWAAAGLMIVLLCALLPILGARGVAIASSVASAASLLLLLRALNRALPHAHERGKRRHDRVRVRLSDSATHAGAKPAAR